MLKKIHLFRLQIPFQLQITHNLADRVVGESIVAIAEDEFGIKGYGEGTPREYVTGEKISDSMKAGEVISTIILQDNPITQKGILHILHKVGSLKNAESCPSAMCAIETACLDLMARQADVSLWNLFSKKPVRNSFEYSAVLPILPQTAQDKIINVITRLQIKYVKIKINDIVAGLSNIAQIRKKLGPGVNLRVDANGAFSSTEAIEFLKKAKPYSLSGFEQPVPKNDIDGLRKVATDNQGVIIIADESMCTMEDAQMLIDNKACQGFSIRLSKCGGFLKSIALCQLAKKNNIHFQIGCHVGESSILSAAGRQLAALCPDILHLEGSFSKYIFEEDIIDKDISFGKSGLANLLPGPGLGIDVNYNKLLRYAEPINTFAAVRRAAA